MKIRLISVTACLFVVQLSLMSAVFLNNSGAVENPSLTETTETNPLNSDNGSRQDIHLNTTDGFCLETEGRYDFSLCLGALFQGDYRYYDYDDADPGNNKFDIRRAQLKISGRYEKRFGYFFKYEFEGAGSRRLLDAYLNIDLLDYLSVRAGQFKEPFGLELNTSDSDLFFAERSIGYGITPKRDVGLMIYSSLADDSLIYGLGVFNGDGPDDTTGGKEDAPQFAGRVVVAPFRAYKSSFFKGFQFGGSLGYGKIDSNNVSIHLQTTGLTTFFDVATRAKFNIIRDADDAKTYGGELAWVYGPFAVTGEYIHKSYNDITTSANRFDIDLRDYYATIAWMITGETIRMGNGVFQALAPENGYGKWGCVGLALRFDSFSADDGVYDTLINSGDSVRKAEAYTLSVNWYVNQFTRLILDATRTKFDRPLLIYRDSLSGTSMFSDVERVLTGRISFNF